MTPSGIRATVFLFLTAIAGPCWAASVPGATPGPLNAITDVPGITVGQFTGVDSGATIVRAGNATGAGVAGGVTNRGGSPGTRETDLMRPDNMVEAMNAIMLSGGGAWGLATASGAMRCLEDLHIGFSVGGGQVVPIIPTAVTNDRATCGGAPLTRPDFAAGHQACTIAVGGPVAQGNVGAGTGAVAGGVKGGVGTASVVLPNGIIVGALVVVNPQGTPYDRNGDLYARGFQLGKEFKDVTSAGALGSQMPPVPLAGPLRSGTLAVVATNVTLTKSSATKIAEMADDGVARAINPAHTPGDGDTLFVLGTARLSSATLGDAVTVQNMIGTAAADAVSRAIVHALLEAQSTTCHKSYCDAFPAACRNRPR